MESASEFDRWVGAGLITAEQRAAIETFETERRRAAAERPSPRATILAEVVGSLGALAAAVGAVLGVVQLWGRLEPWARVALPTIGAFVLLGVSSAFPGREERALARLGALLSLLGIGAAVTACVILTVDTLDWAAQNVVLVAGLVGLLLGGAVLRYRPEPHLVVVVSAAVVTIAVGLVTQYDHVRTEQSGVAVTAAALIVGLLGWSGWLPSMPTTDVLAAAGAIVGTQMMGTWSSPWSIGVAGAIAVAFLLAFVADRHRTLLLGGLALSISALVRGVIELTRNRRPGEANGVGAIAVVLIVGIALLTIAVVAARRRPPVADTKEGTDG